jgi:hypothetical protein
MSTPGGTSLQHIKTLAYLHLSEFVRVESYEFASCYLWHDRPLYNDFGEQIRLLRGNTIYLFEKSTSLNTDLFHELGHFVGRTCNVVGHRENGYRGTWQLANAKVIAEVTEQRHWSPYLNEFARSQSEFRTNAASELWAELFMLWHLHPDTPEARIIDTAMTDLRLTPVCDAIGQLADTLRIAQ